MQPHAFEPQAIAESAEALRHGERSPRRGAIRLVGEHERIVGKSPTACPRSLLAAIELRGQKLDGRVIQSDPPSLMGLGVLLHEPTFAAYDAACDQQCSSVEIHGRPSRPAQLPAPCARRGRETQEGPEAGIFDLRGPEQSGDILGGGRLGIGALQLGR